MVYSLWLADLESGSSIGFHGEYKGMGSLIIQDLNVGFGNRLVDKLSGKKGWKKNTEYKYNKDLR